MRRLIENLTLCIAIGFLTAAGSAAEIIHWESDLQTAMGHAQATQRPLLLHFWTPECVPCQRLEQTVFNQPRVAEAMQELFIPVKIDANEYPELAARYGIKSVPKDVIITPDDQELHRMFTPQDPDQYVAQLTAVAFRAGASRSARELTDAQVANNPPDQQTADPRWSEYSQMGGSSGQRDAANPPYARGSAFGDSTPIADPGSRAAETYTEPKEVINRFARRGQEAVAPWSQSPPQTQTLAQTHTQTQTPNQSNEVAAHDPVPPGRSRWGDWPASAPNDSPVNDRRNPEPTSAAGSAASQYASAPTDRSMSPATAAPPVGQTPIAQTEPTRPPLGMDGYCPVTLLRKNNWAKGDPRYGVIHRGHLYLFAGPEEKDAFFADPDQYSPVLSGIDAVRLAEAGEVALGERAHGVVYRKRVYLFSSEANLERFWEEPERFASPIRQAMEQGDVGRLFR
jgi:thiol-disulfide isomerase/thioredoxin/YHS domain-containing protein